MSIWHIVEGAAGKMCVVPDGPLLNGRKALKSFACNGLLDAVKILKENERDVVQIVRCRCRNRRKENDYDQRRSNSDS